MMNSSITIPEFEIEIANTKYTAKFAQVGSVFFGISDRDVLAINIQFQFDHSSQGTGFYPLNHTANGAAIDLIYLILQAFKVNELADLEGRKVFVLYGDHNHNALIQGFITFDSSMQPSYFLFSDWRTKWGL